MNKQKTKTKKLSSEFEPHAEISSPFFKTRYLPLTHQKEESKKKSETKIRNQKQKQKQTKNLKILKKLKTFF